MARRARVAVGGLVYHVLNRGNCRLRIFGKSGDFAAFVKLLEEGRKRVKGMRVLGYCLMHNHWHLLLWPSQDKDLSQYLGWVSSTHVRRWREHRRSNGEGHLYQGRYKSFVVQAEDWAYLKVLKYIEQNPLRAQMVQRAEQWPWSSASQMKALAVDQGPIDRPEDWQREVNRLLGQEEMERLHQSLQRNRPFGDSQWLTRVARKLGLQHTINDPWRPRKKRRGGSSSEPRVQRGVESRAK